MLILLNGGNDRAGELRELYLRAFRQAEELLIASAYLTDWNHRDKIGNQCKRAVFTVGTDFGLTRKIALREVLRWMPKKEDFSVGAVIEKGFHPKVVIWRTPSGKHYCIVGSSNLSRAAFLGNVEANLFCPIAAKDYRRIREWIENVETVPVTTDWIDHHYVETKRIPHGKPPSIPIIRRFSSLPTSQGCALEVLKRRKGLPVFARSRGRLEREMLLCSKRNSRAGDRDFWHFMWQEWKKWRFQHGAIQISAKKAKWREACRALLRILDASAKDGASTAKLDHIVKEEIDSLASKENPVRRAWFSEMLCHFFPKLYPVDNQPVRKWLRKNKYPSRRGVGAGRYYVELAQKLREVVREHTPAGARNLAELDAAIRHQV